MSVEPIRTDHTVAEVEEALMALAINGGNFKRTSEDLKAEGRDISARRLRDWSKDVYPGRYELALSRMAEELDRRLIGMAQSAAVNALDVTSMALDQTREKLEAGEYPDPARVARDTAVVMGVNVDKAQVLRLRPYEVQESRTAQQLMRALFARIGGTVPVDGSAEEVPLADELPPAA
ncbi:MAG: hypothetical protein ACEQSX_18585 [Baekduiaceae bacterium]